MTGKTHKQYAICGGLIAGMLMYGTGFTEVNYYLSLPILVMASQAGGKFPDLDHNWENVKDKNIVTKIVNTLIHLTGGKHRSVAFTQALYNHLTEQKNKVSVQHRDIEKV